MRAFAGTLLYIGLMVPAVALGAYIATVGGADDQLWEIQSGAAVLAMPVGLYYVHRRAGREALEALRSRPIDAFRDNWTVAFLMAVGVMVAATVAFGLVLAASGIGDAIT